MQNANIAASKECKNKYFFSTALARQKLIYFFPIYFVECNLSLFYGFVVAKRNQQEIIKRCDL